MFSSSSASQLIWVVPLLPFLGFIVNGLLSLIPAWHGERLDAPPAGRRTLVSIVGVGVMAVAFALTVMLAQQVGSGETSITSSLGRWMSAGTFSVDWMLRVDRLSVLMMLVITGVGSLIHIYSTSYMADDAGFARYFAYLNLFVGFMLMLVMGANLPVLFIGWEGVGLASYLLIGFWYKKRSANDAAIKAFVVNRVGDFGFALGIMAVYLTFGSIKFDDVFAAVPQKLDAVIAFGNVFTVPALEAIGLLLFIGAMGKSAQFFLHTWLPDAMEGPTPVSALIHAATMVTAGVVLVCRCSPIYEYAPGAAGVITVLGAVTALFAATVGLAQNDIKRVIAYSTCSQLGYMFFAAGIGAYQAAMFHLFTHAFFKALLFLGAGSVIHGMHHEQDMRRMGAVGPAMPITWAMMIIGTLAITGIGIPGTGIGFAGFFSKDAVLESAFAAGEKGVSFAYMAFWVGLLAAMLTSFYSWRLAYMTFNGHYRGAGHDHAHHDDHAHGGDVAHAHAAPAMAGGDHDHHDHSDAVGSKKAPGHESPLVMLVPLFVLAAGALIAGAVFYNAFVGDGAKAFWDKAIYMAADNTVLKDKKELHHHAMWVLWAPLVVTITGFLVATYFYLLNEGLGAKIAANNGPLHRFLSNKWYFDELYDAVFVKGARALGDLFWKGGDQKIIDGLGPNGIATATNFIAKRVVKLQSGYVYHYGFIMLAGAVMLGAFGLWIWGR
jgi:NADH-quinone oxidoreductase subunit L